MKERLDEKGMREQLPRYLRFLDDRWGLTWRILNRLKTINPRRAWRFHTARFRKIQYRQPVFVFGAPRSGTTAVFRLLGAHPDLAYLGWEAHDCWRRYHHPRLQGWRSEAVGAGQVSVAERSFVYRYFYARLGERRFVEKTGENCFRIPYLLDLFPDAHFIWAKRDPRATMSSMINGWRHPLGRFRSYYVPERLEIQGYQPKHQWCFGLIEGWQELRQSTIPQIVGRQWAAYVRGAAAGRHIVPPDRWNELCFEDLLEDPDRVTRNLLDRLGLAHDPDVLRRASDLLTNPVNTMAESGPGDWRQNEKEILDLLPQLRAEILTCGYDPDALPARSAVPERVVFNAETSRSPA